MKRIFQFFVIVPLLMLLLVSCGSVMALYDVGLSSVESPENAKEQFGETKIVKITEDKLDKYRYEDKYISITWYYLTTQLEFELVNKSDFTLKINWDDVSYVDYNGNVSRIMHKGVKYSEREQSQGSINIPKNGRLFDIIVPTSNVYLSQGFYVPTEWKHTAIFPCYYKNKSEMKKDVANGTWIGRTVRVLFPIEIEGVKNDYTFEFRVEDVLNK